jgi:GntR family transcriptional regulator
MNFDPMIPIWLQVATSIKQQIVTGRLPPGAKLPGGRDLALQYGINPNTAARIYQELEREGVCQTQRGLGTFVTDSGETVQRLREEMARGAVSRFLADLKGIGMNREDAIELIRKEDNTDDHQ